MAGGDASIQLDLDAQQLYQELQNVQSHLAQFASKAKVSGEEASKGFTSGFKLGNIGQNLAGALAGLGLGAEIKSVVEYGAKIEDLHQKFGVSTDAIQKFGNAAEKNGGSLEGIAKAFRFLEVNQAKALGGSEAHIKAFAELGVSVSDLESLRPEDIMLKIGASSANAADFVKVLGKSALDSRVTLTGLADGTIQFGDAISDVNIAALKEADVAFKELKEKVTILVGSGLGAFFEGVETVAGGLTGHIQAIAIELQGLADAAEKLAPKGASPEATLRIAQGLGTPEDFKSSGPDFAGARDVLTKAHKDADEAIIRGYDATNEVLAGKKADRAKKRDLGDPTAIEQGEAGETDDQGRPLKKGAAESALEKEEKLGDKLEQKEEERYLKSVGYEERIAELRSKAAEELTESHESRDYDDRTQAAIEYYDTLKDIDTVEKEHLADIAKEARERKTEVETAAREKQTAEKKAEHDERRALNPAHLSLEDFAKSNLIGGAAGDQTARAQEAVREGALAKDLALKGELGASAEHGNRAEELKKSLGLPNEIDSEKNFQNALDKSEAIKKIAANTEHLVDIGANK